jgi:diguanylate cyclase (GGDEF)-like protein/PAS domain S-box-containing protein
MEAALITHDSYIDRQYFEQIVTKSSEGILLIDAQDQELPVVYANPAYEAMTGYRAREMVGQRWHVLDRERGEHRGIDDLQKAVERAEPIEVELPDLRKDGTVWIARIGFSKLQDSRGEVRYYLIQQRESPRRLGLGSKVEGAVARPRPEIASFAGRIDPVTGLPHYDHFAAILNRDIGIARRDRKAVALMVFEVIELDVYKRTFGAKAADSCIRMIGAQISGTLRRAGDLCARYNDTMLVAAVLGQDVAQAASLAERIVANVRGLRLHNPRASLGRYITVESALSGGVPRPEDDVDALVERARRTLEGRRRGVALPAEAVSAAAER